MRLITPIGPRRLERLIAIVRLIAVPLAVFQVAFGSTAPGGHQTLAWSTTVVFAIGAGVLYLISARELTGRGAFVLGVVALCFDLAVVSAYVLAYSTEPATLIPETLFLPVIEGSVRFAALGGVLVALATVPVMIAFEKLHSNHFGQSFRWEYVSLHIAVELLLAVLVGKLVSRLAVESREASARAEEALELRDELARRVDTLDAVNRCARALSSSLELPEAFASFVRELRGLVPFDRVAIVLAEDGVAQVMATVGVGADSVFPAGSWAPLEGTLLEEVLVATHPVYRPRLDPADYPEEHEFRELGLGSRLAAPLLTGPKPLGMLSLVRREEDAFTTEETELIGLLGRLVATTAQNIRTFEAERRTVDELRRLSTMRADFVSLVSHELRTPLAAVIGSARTLQARWRELTEEQRGSFLALIADETDRLANLVGDVLDTSRIDAETFTYSFADVDLAGLVEETVAAASLGQDAVQVVARIPSSLPVVLGDGARLRQVLANLVDNAVKYSPEGETVEVRATAVDGRVMVDVTDHGSGIAVAEQRMIFEKFGRASSSPTKPGTGLGLYIARAIAEAHGGTLDVSSAPGMGATFSLSLPGP
jgi:signal transduction histidine kinase